jgi:hypothetical protein
LALFERDCGIGQSLILRRKPVNMRRTYILIMLCFVTTVLVAQEDFSANIVDQRVGKETAGQVKIYVTKDKMRVDSAQPNGRSGAMILNLASQTNTILLPERKMYIESVSGQGPDAQRKWTFFRVTDAENACADWQKIPAHQGGTCQKGGHETLNGRSTVKYTGTSKNGDSATVWVDTKLDFPIKWQDQGGGGELQDIKEGSQPASLFEIPADYEKMQMPAGMHGMPPQR